MDDDWTPQWAADVARREGIALGERQWFVIAAVRESIANDAALPKLADVSARCGVTHDELNDLFPGDAEEILARLAGAPELERRR